jgi:predicted phosphodiesterase
MRICVISDIHGNVTALEAVIADLRKTSPDLVLHGGDLAANGARPAAVVDRIRDLGWPGVCGNTDEMICEPGLLSESLRRAPERSGLRRVMFEEITPRTRELLGEERIGWLKTLPRLQRYESIAILHAAPTDLWRAPLFDASDDQLDSTYSPLRSSVAVYAHIHHPFIRRLVAMTVANTGSLSLSYDGDTRASYLLIDGPHLSIRRVEYDIELEAAVLLRSRLPRAEWLCHILQTGRFIYPP